MEFGRFNTALNRFNHPSIKAGPGAHSSTAGRAGDYHVSECHFRAGLMSLPPSVIHALGRVTDSKGRGDTSCHGIQWEETFSARVLIGPKNKWAPGSGALSPRVIGCSAHSVNRKAVCPPRWRVRRRLGRLSPTGGRRTSIMHTGHMRTQPGGLLSVAVSPPPQQVVGSPAGGAPARQALLSDQTTKYRLLTPKKWWSSASEWRAASSSVYHGQLCPSDLPFSGPLDGGETYGASSLPAETL
ncbi:unnamed protein product [Boreogadus saida]